MFATLTISGSAAASTQTACGRRARTIRLATIRCSRRSLSLRSSCSPRWSSTAGSELRRVEPARATVETLAPERRTSSSGLAPMKAASGVPTAEAEAGRELLAHGAEEGGRVVGGGGADDHLAGEHDLAHLPRADPVCGGGDGGFEVSRRAGAADLRVRGRVRVEHRQRRLAAQAGEPGAQRRAPLLRVVPGLDDGVDGEEGALAAAADRELGQDQRAGRERGPGRGGAALGVEGEAAEPDRPGAGRQPARLVENGVAACSQALLGDVGERASRRARRPRGRRRARPARTRGRAAPSRTSGRRPAARRRPPRRDRRSRPRR